MERNDDYGLNENEVFIYRVAKVILQEQKEINVYDIDMAIDDSIEVGLGRRITEDFSYKLVKARLCNFFDVKNDGLVPMPVNRKAQAEHNKRFGIEE